MMRRFSAAAVSLVLLAGSISPVRAFAEPYDSYTYDRWGDAVPSQAGYIAERAVSGADLGIGDLSGLSDIFRAGDGTFYLVDTGNDRIVAVDSEFSEVTEIYDTFTTEEGMSTRLKEPSGVFVSDELIYIADTGNSRVLVSDHEGRIEMEITKPETGIYDQKKTFLPQKVIADKGGNIYVVLNNITTGAAMFDQSGEFAGFYGPNRVEPTAQIVWEHIRGIFMSDEKKARRRRSVPTGITGFDVDGDFIYTCTASSSQSTDTVKKLNAAGKNIFSGYDVTFGDYTPMYDSAQNRLLASAIVDIDISEDGNINCLDRTAGRIFQYDEDCKLLFITGAIADQLGGFDTVSAIESAGDRLYVTDSAKNTVTIFRETDFGRLVHEASALHNGGYYEEALEPWLEVLSRDGNYRRAYTGAAAGYLRKGEYKESMKYARLAGEQRIYNKAFEGYRREFLQKNSGLILSAAGILLAAAVIIGIIRKRKFRRREEQ